MSRTHCTACDLDVVVDPTGRCPDGHLVGAAGPRVAAAIGSAVPHPDEPEPWVARVEVDDLAIRAADAAETIGPVTGAASPVAGHRPASLDGRQHPSDLGSGTPAPRPIPSPAGPLPEVAAPAEGLDDAEDLLRELHALGGFGAAASPSRVAPTPAPAPAAMTMPAAIAASAAPATPPDSAPAARPAPPPDDVLDELTALEAAVQALDLDRTAAPTTREPQAPIAPPAAVRPTAAPILRAVPPLEDASEAPGAPTTVPLPVAPLTPAPTGPPAPLPPAAGAPVVTVPAAATSPADHDGTSEQVATGAFDRGLGADPDEDPGDGLDDPFGAGGFSARGTRAEATPKRRGPTSTRRRSRASVRRTRRSRTVS